MEHRMLSSPNRRARTGALLFASICAASVVFASLSTRWQTATAAATTATPRYFATTQPAPDKGAITPAAGNTITVNSTADVANGTDGLCTLGEAITAANNNTASGAVSGECGAGSSGGDDTINFSINGTINLASVLPNIASSMVINGP